MAADQDDLTNGPVDGSDALSGGMAAQAPADAGRPDAARQALGTSVWQQSVAAWQEAGIDWLREARPGPSPEDHAAAEADLRHTEPIPVIPAFDPPGHAGVSGPAAETAADEDLIVLGAAGAAAAGPGTSKAGSPAENRAAAAEAPLTEAPLTEAPLTEAPAGKAPAGKAPAGKAPAGKAPAGKAPAGKTPAAGTAADEDLIVLASAEATAAAETGPGTGNASPATGARTAAPESVAAAGIAAGPGSAAAGAPAERAQATAAAAPAVPGGTVVRPVRAGPGRRAVVVAAATAVALAGATIAGIAVARSGGAPRHTFALVTPYPAAALADADFPAQQAGPGLPASLTGIAAAGKTIVAVGSQGGASVSVPLILDSQDGGRTWATAALGHSSVPPGPGAVPVLVAHGPGNWLAVGQGPAWASADGQAWQAEPGLPMSAGDKILGLTRTHTGFVAVGQNIPGPAGSGVPSPVLWTSANGRTWQRRSGAALTIGASGGLDAGGGSMVSLRWAADRGNVVMVGGEVSRPWWSTGAGGGSSSTSSHPPCGGAGTTA